VGWRDGWTQEEAEVEALIIEQGGDVDVKNEWWV